MPSALASATSQGEAGSSSGDSRAMRLTEAAPCRRATRATSMATLPPPMTATRLPWVGDAPPEFTSFKILHPPQDAGGLGSGDRQADGILGPHPEEDRREPVPGEEIVDAGAFADGRVVADFHPQARQIVHFPLAGLPGAGDTPGCRSAASRRPRAAASKITVR